LLAAAHVRAAGFLGGCGCVDGLGWKGCDVAGKARAVGEVGLVDEALVVEEDLLDAALEAVQTRQTGGENLQVINNIFY